VKPLLRLKPYLARYRRTLLWGLVTVVLSNLFTVAQPLIIGRAIDALKDGLTGHSIDMGGVLLYAGIVVGCSLVAGIFTFLTRQTIIVVSRHIEFDLRNTFLSHIQKLSYSFFQRTPTGDLMALATNDIGAVRNALGPGIMYPVDTLCTFVMVFAVMLRLDWSLTLLTLIPLPFVSFAVYRLGKLVHSKFEERQKKYSDLTTRAQENLSGIRVIKAYVREQYESELFRALSWDYLKKNLVLARVQSIMWPLMFLLIGFSLVIALYGGGLKVINGELTIGTLTAFFGYLVMLIWPMIAFGWVVNILQQGAASMGRLNAILDTKPDIADGPSTRTDIDSLKGEIEFRDVVFRHDGTSVAALNGISLTIPAGTTLAIIGFTGSGKTTMVNLIARLYEASEGEILIDGVNVKDIPVDVLRGGIGYVPQETFLFSTSIADNIRYGSSDADHEELRWAADIAQIAKDVEEFPKGFETVLGERGITLSGGQKQRTSIARAVIRKPSILILDDSLSAVDTLTEDEILTRLRSVMAQRTSILISHRISTVKHADRIIVLDNGTIVEEGTHESLVARGGIYSGLHRKQLLEQALEEIR
jgi:ATP-binding cassette subfamily B protein